MPRRGDNIHKRKDGRWEGRYYIIDSSGGKKLHSIYARSYKKCREKLRTEQSEYDRQNMDLPAESPDQDGFTAQSEVLTLAAQKWLEVIHDKRKYATYVKYENIYRKYISPVLDAHAEGQIEWRREILEKQDIPSASVGKCICSVLNGIIGYAAELGLCDAKKLHMRLSSESKSKKAVEIFTQSEQILLLDYLYQDMDTYKMGIALCLMTGIRLGEICSLRNDSIDRNSGVLRIESTVQRITAPEGEAKTCLLESKPKSECSERSIPLSDESLRIIETYGSKSTYLIGGKHPVEPRSYQYRFKKYLSEAGVPYKNFHVLRHTFASNCICSGIDVKSVSEILGHCDVRITLNRYVHPSMEIKRAHMNSLSSVYGQIRGQETKKA